MFNPDLPQAIGSAVIGKYGDDDDQVSEAVRWLAQIQDFVQMRDASVRRAWDAVDTLYKQGVIDGDWDCLTIEKTLIQTSDVDEIMETIEATVLGGMPKFMTHASTMQKEEGARHFRTIINAHWAQNPHVFNAHVLAERDCITKGQGVVSNEVILDYDEAERAKKKRDKEARRLLESPALAGVTLQLQQQRALYEDSTPGDDDEYPDTYLWDQNVRRNCATSRYVPIESFIRDPYRERPEQWTFKGESLIVDFDALVNDDTLYVPKNLKPDLATNAQEMSEGGAIRPMFMTPLTKGLLKQRPVAVARRLKMIHRVWALDHEEDGCPIWRMMILTRGAKKPLLERTVPDPFNVLEWNQKGGINFPKSDVMKALIGILEKRGARSSIYEKMARSAQSTLIYDKGDIPHKADLQGVVRGISANYVGIDNRMNKSLNDLFKEIKPTSLTQEDIAYLQLLEDSRRQATGMGQNQNLEAMKSGTTATEAQEVATRSQLRSIFKNRQVNEWLVRSAKKTLQDICYCYDSDRIRDLAGPEAAAWYERQNFSESNLRDLPIEIQRGSMQIETDEQQAAKLIGDLQFASTQPVILAMMRVQEMLQEVFRLQGFPDPSKFLRQLPPDTIDQMLAAQIMGQLMGGQKGSAPKAKNQPQGALSNGGTSS